MVVKGSNPVALREVAQECDSGAVRVEWVIKVLKWAIQTLQASAFGSWVRPLIDALFEVINTLRGMVERLHKYQKTLLENAGEQDQASDTRRAGIGGGGGSTSPANTSGKAKSPLEKWTELLKAGAELAKTLTGQPATPTTTAGPSTTPTTPVPAPVPTPTPNMTAVTDVPVAHSLSPIPPPGNVVGAGWGGAAQGEPLQMAGGIGGLDTGSPPGEPVPPQVGEPAVFGRPTVDHHPVAAAVREEAGYITTDAIALDDRGAGVPVDVVASVLGGAGMGVLVNKFVADRRDAEALG